jgi:hypothetical protein
MMLAVSTILDYDVDSPRRNYFLGNLSIVLKFSAFSLPLGDHRCIYPPRAECAECPSYLIGPNSLGKQRG